MMILVTGGTGMLGAHLLYQLCLQNTEIKAIKRKHSDLNQVRKIFSFYTESYEEIFNKIRWIEVDITNFEEIDNALDNVDIVYHAAAVVSFNPHEKKMMKSVNVAGTANIVNAALKRNIKKLCHVSTIAFLNPLFENETVDENAGRKPSSVDSDYSQTKYAAELEVWRGIAEGLNAVIVNPSIILGAGNWKTGSPQLFSRAKKGLRYFTDGSSGFVDVRDVVEIMIQIMKSDIHSERFILNSENLKYQDVFEMIESEIGKKTKKKYISKNTLKFLSIIDSAVSGIMRKSPLLPASVVNSAYSKTIYSNRKITEALNYQFLPIRDSIRDIAKIFSESKNGK
jgi:nucleoside-diphosphate-sugar epimerase